VCGVRVGVSVVCIEYICAGDADCGGFFIHKAHCYECGALSEDWDWIKVASSFELRYIGIV
jgi:hypothetical protein